MDNDTEDDCPTKGGVLQVCMCFGPLNRLASTDGPHVAAILRAAFAPSPPLVDHWACDFAAFDHRRKGRWKMTQF